MTGRSGAVWRSSDAGNWLVGPVPELTSRWRLLCIPHAGGGPSFFRPWAACLPGGVEFWIAQLPGRESRYRETLPARIQDIAEELALALSRLPAKPTLLFGHSFGALIAFELAHRLRANESGQPALLALSGRVPPGEGGGPAHLLHLSDSAFIEAVAAEYGGIAPVVMENPALRELYAPVLRADMRLVAEYEPASLPALNCPLYAFGGEADPHVPAQSLLGWGAYTQGGFERRLFPGGHFYLSEHISAVIAELFAGLACPA